jgi:CheY-like chemotaxis protein
MQNKTALIVDDSRTASQMLRLMLEREEFQVDVLGNAEAAVGYLRDHRPGIIFMDHLMPGMDGFQAVKEIKSNSLAAQIPIVMYTAKSGDLYVGQAQALGAVDILPKPPTRELLRAVFRRLDERTSAANEPMESAPVPEPAVAEVTVSGAVSETGEAVPEPPPARLPERTLPVAAPNTEFLREFTADAEAGAGGRRVSWLLALVVAVAAFAAGMQFAPPPPPAQAWTDTIGWALGETLDYPYGEAPFSGSRVALVQGLVERLASTGFKGTVRLEGHAGQFCLRASQGGWRVADDATPLESCDVKGFFNKQDARTASARQSPEFRAMLEGLAASAPGIRVVVEGVGDDKRRADYPTPDRVKSAGEWNRVAAENNRIGISLVPDA